MDDQHELVDQRGHLGLARGRHGREGPRHGAGSPREPAERGDPGRAGGLNQVPNQFVKPFGLRALLQSHMQRTAQTLDQLTDPGRSHRPSDVEQVRRGLVRELGPTNFAHFWEDVPVLDPNDKRRSVAQNCLFLACVSALGSGGYESLDDLVDAQAQMNLEPRDRLPAQELQEVETGLLRRRVISRSKSGGRRVEVELPVFRDWLLEKGEAELLPVWRTFQDEEAAEPAEQEPGSLMIVEAAAFPIEEDKLLSVSEKLVYLGKQKDVAEVRRWLRQFDDDARIEVAFLLLKRLVEYGFVNDGAFVNGLAKMEESVRARRQGRRRRSVADRAGSAAGQPVLGLCGLGDEERCRDRARTCEADEPGEVRPREQGPNMGAGPRRERPTGCCR